MKMPPHSCEFWRTLKICKTSDLKTKLRALYKVVEPYDAEFQHTQYPGCDDIISAIALCAFLGNKLFDDVCRWMKYEDWKEIIFCYNDIYALHHDHFSDVVYGLAHKRCNSKVRVGSAEYTTINVYAHFGIFDFSFLLCGIDVNTLLNLQMNNETIKLFVGGGANRFDYMLLGQLFFKDSMKMFPSPLAELCATKTAEECQVVTDTLFRYLSRSSDLFQGHLCALESSD